MLLVKEPVPDPSVVWLSVATGFGVMFQHTPRAVTGSPPSAVTSPPEDAVVEIGEAVTVRLV